MGTHPKPPNPLAMDAFNQTITATVEEVEIPSDSERPGTVDSSSSCNPWMTTHWQESKCTASCVCICDSYVVNFEITLLLETDGHRTRRPPLSNTKRALLRRRIGTRRFQFLSSLATMHLVFSSSFELSHHPWCTYITRNRFVLSSSTPVCR